jgi:hypothetical protein
VAGSAPEGDLMDITLESVKRLTLQPGDTLVLAVDEGLSGEELSAYSESMRQAFPNHRTVVLDSICELAVVSPPPGT